MCGGDGTAMCGEPRVAAECTLTEREFSRCSRPTVRPGRTANDERDHGDGSDTRPRGRCSWQRLVAPRSNDPDVAWLVNGLAAQPGIEPSGP